MFDWSGVYFREVVKQEIFTLGYLIFMIFMAVSRFYSDRVVDKLGMQKTYLISGSFIAVGIGIVILFPYYWPVLIGFSITGVGVASIVPMTFTLAGRSTKYSPGMAISMVATYSIVGMLIGPSLIGYISHWMGLQYSFILFVLGGILLIPISKRVFKILKE
jgi:MFS family permease